MEQLDEDMFQWRRNVQTLCLDIRIQNLRQVAVRIQITVHLKMTHISRDIKLDLYFLLNLPYEADAGSTISCIFILYEHTNTSWWKLHQNNRNISTAYAS
jgi:hypothetical protein